MARIDGQRHILDRLGGNIDLGQLPQLGQHRVIAGDGLSLDRHHLQLWVELREERCHHVVETVEHAEHNDQCHGGHGNAHHRNHGDDVDGVGGLLREEVAAGYIEGKGHLLLQEFVNMVDVVEGVVDEEAQFGDDAHLVADARAQLVADGLHVRVDVLDDFLAALAGEYAQVGGADAQVGRYLGARNADHDAVHGARLLLKNLCQFLLQQAGNLVLSCFLHIG